METLTLAQISELLPAAMLAARESALEEARSANPDATEEELAIRAIEVIGGDLKQLRESYALGWTSLLAASVGVDTNELSVVLRVVEMELGDESEDAEDEEDEGEEDEDEEDEDEEVEDEQMARLAPLLPPDPALNGDSFVFCYFIKPEETAPARPRCLVILTWDRLNRLLRRTVTGMQPDEPLSAEQIETWEALCKEVADESRWVRDADGKPAYYCMTMPTGAYQIIRIHAVSG